MASAVQPRPAGARLARAGHAVADVPAPSASVARLRTEMLTALVEGLNAAELPYCLLDGFEDYPDTIATDVDLMVSPVDAGRVASVLRQVASASGAWMVQAIQHETGACYFVLAQQQDRQVAYLHPDCSADYRRGGRMWLKAEEIVRDRQPYKNFFVPAIPDEFLYYMIKKVVKQRITLEQLRRLGNLYLSCPGDCQRRLLRFWSDATTKSMERALLRQELSWFRFYLPTLLSELRASAPMEGLGERCLQGLQEWRRLAARLRRPTGLLVQLSGGTAQQRAEFASALESALRPAFRQTRVHDSAAGKSRLRTAVEDRIALARSTLVIDADAPDENHRGSGNEVHFVLHCETSVCGSNNHSAPVPIQCGSSFRLAGASLQAEVEQACAIVLQRMAARLISRQAWQPTRVPRRLLESGA